MTEKELRLESTPLQKILGFEIAEEIYDMLPITAQLIIDLKIEGWTEQEIAKALDIAQSTVNDTFKKSRYILLKSKLHTILEVRQYYKETHPQVMDLEEVHSQAKDED